MRWMLRIRRASCTVHRDIKAPNIFVTRRGQAKILDFGLAKLTPRVVVRKPRCLRGHRREADQSGNGGLHVAGAGAGRRTRCTRRSVVVWRGADEMATGARPFTGNTTAALFDSILHKVPVSPVQLNRETLVELERIINKALEKEREIRCQTASELRADLQRLKRDTSSSLSPVNYQFRAQLLGLAVAVR
jgi:serine/threonine protein kinase